MTRDHMFKPNGDGYDMTLAGVVLVCAGAAYGSPAETTRQGRKNALRLINRVLNEASHRGFANSDLVRSLLLLNSPTSRLINLVQDACDSIEMSMHEQIICEARR